MEHVKVYLLDSKAEVQYGLNWGHRDNRDKNQSYLQLLPEVYNGDFFPIAGKYFIAKTDDKKTIIFNRAQKGKGTALQTPESNALLGLYLRKRLGLLSEAEISREDILNYGKLDIDFYKTDEDLTYIMAFNKNWKSLDILYIYKQFLMISHKCNNWKDVNAEIEEIKKYSQFVFNFKNEENEVIHISLIDDYLNLLHDNEQLYNKFIKENEATLSLFSFLLFLKKDFFNLHYGKDEFLYKDNKNINMNTDSQTLQQIFYGAPGTGKSHAIEVATEGQDVIRTTFHPDSDYSTFVGAYKPTTKEIPMRDVTGKVIIENGKPVTENRIVYEFVNQAFLQAYVAAWKKLAENQTETQRQYLVIEEINRGNCAQIFGDLFQLLDRNNDGFSEYPIKADTDMKKQLKKQLDGLTIKNPDIINALYKGKDIVGQVLDGDILLLPNNLYIWATMNTSDQSLFPIDSAFKRRWDWKYVRIDNARKNWKITVNDKKYDWWDFLEKINALVGETTSSEDKKLGYFFCKAANGTISSETFVSKVVFYLWNDVFKDYEFDNDVFNDEPKDGETNKLSFDKFYMTNAGDQTVVNEKKVDVFLTNLKVTFVDEGEEVANVDSDEEYNGAKRGVAHRQLLAVTFPDGTKFDVDDGLTHFSVFLESIKKIGVERAEQIASASKYHRFNRPIISKERYPEIEDSNFSYVQVGECFIIKGVSDDTYINILNLCSEQLNLDLDVKFRQ